MKKGIILSGGSIDLELARSVLKEDYYEIIAADRGVIACEKLGVTPDLIVGDFDSAGEEEKLRWRASAVPVQEFNPVKDWTDTEIAVDQGIARGWEEMIILGGTGTRLDHVMGNLQVLAKAEDAGVTCILLDPHNRIRLHSESFAIRKAEQWGKYVSIFAFGGDVTGLSLKGFFYPTDNITLTNRGSLGVSNQIVEETAVVEFTGGTVLAIESRD